jgi:hypothetical protein
MCARKVATKVKKPTAKVTKKPIAKASKKVVVAKCKISKRVKLGELPETYVKGFHNINDVKKMKYSPLGVTGMNVS